MNRTSLYKLDVGSSSRVRGGIAGCCGAAVGAFNDPGH